jgi:ribosome-binding factor A
MSDRHERVASLIKHHAATFIQHEANTTPLITVTHVTIAPDFRRATVYITTIPNDREYDAIIFLKRMGSELRQYLKEKCQLKIIPHLDFDIDVGERHRQHMDEIVRKIDNPAP